MILVDIETSNFHIEKQGIWQFDEINLSDLGNKFLDECRIDEENEVTINTQKVNGKFNWTKNTEIENYICQSLRFDLSFLTSKVLRHGLETPFQHRAFDLHPISALQNLQIHKNFLIGKGRSNMSLSCTLNFCGLKDSRKERNTLEDTGLIAECFSRLTPDRNLFPEYSQHKIPEVLRR